jgi:hypothetical protein
MTAVVRREVDIAAPAEVAWAHLTDWRRQGEWIAMTRVEPIGSADGVGGRIRAWTGVGPVGFWDTMTITGWEVSEDGSARCEVLHTGRVVRGDGGFSVRPTPGGCRLTWWERLEIPGGRAGALAWRLVGPVMSGLVGVSLRKLARNVERVR